MKLPPNRFELAAAVRREVADLGDGGELFVACSGGPDSLALAAATADARLTATAVIVDHGLQTDSAAVADSAAEQCRRLGLESKIVRAVVQRSGAGPEAQARSARYEALESVAGRSADSAVLLGHTADDQAEAVLLGLVRGSGARSLAGMPRRRGPYRRPFLDIRRIVVEAALAENGLLPWRDPHNTDPRYLRARVRSRVMPVLAAELGSGVAAGLIRTAQLSRADADALDALAADAHRGFVAAGGAVAAVAELADAIRWRVLRRELLAAGCPAQDLTLEHVRAVDALVTGWHGQGPLHLPGRVVVQRRYGTLVAEHRPDPLEG